MHFRGVEHTVEFFQENVGGMFEPALSFEIIEKTLGVLVVCKILFIKSVVFFGAVRNFSLRRVYPLLELDAGFELMSTLKLFQFFYLESVTY